MTIQSTVLPRGVSGDVYNLADCLQQQAVIGSTANPLVLNYLKHSLCAHLVSHAAVLRCIAKYDKLGRVYCVTALLEFLVSIIDGITCRSKSEESLLPGAMVQLVHWIMQIFARTVQQYEMRGEMSAEQSYMLDQSCKLIERLTQQQFLLAMLYVGCHEELDALDRIRDLYASIKASLTNSNMTLSTATAEQQLQQLAYIDAKQLDLQYLNPAPSTEKISCCVQPLLAVEVLLNPCKDTSYYVAELQMLQRLKGYTNTRLFYEIIRAGFLTLSNVADTSPDTINLTWQDICLNLPGVLHHVLIAWEQETLSSADVKSILDNIKRRLFSFSVCATSFLCAYMYSVRETELLKPLNMIQQFLAPLTSEELSSQENAKERLALSYQIIRKMQHDVHPAPNTKSRLISHTPLIEQFRECWRSVHEAGHLPVRAAQTLESLLLAGGASWLVTQLVEQLISCKYMRDMAKCMDIVFAVMHLDIERTTEALLQYVVAPLILRRQDEDINEPQSLVLARLCVYCIISCLETRSSSAAAAFKKRSRSHDEEELVGVANAAKVRKIIGDGSDNSNDFAADATNVASSMLSTPSAELRATPLSLKEPLQSSVKHIFRVFLQFVSGDELSPKAIFVYQFISLLVECGGERVAPVLRLLPGNLMQQLLKVLATDDIRVGLISRLYDLRLHAGRQAAVADLCLWRNMQLARHSIHL
ncbi:hypothetical protein ACLKA7_017314 [Drosophila subpalustris]